MQKLKTFNYHKLKTLIVAGLIGGATTCKAVAETNVTYTDKTHITNIEKFNLSSKYDSLNISVMVYYPTNQPIAVVQLVHGMCGCKERFQSLMEFLSGNGIVCIASDLRGHGQSIKNENDLGYFYSGGYKALVDDIRIVSNWALDKFPNIPFFLVGHSMGSMAARVYTKQDDSFLSGLIICGSPSKNNMSGLGKFLTNVACSTGFDKHRSKILQQTTDKFYNKRFVSEGSKAWTCSDPESRKTFKENPKCNFSFTMNGTYNLMAMMEETYNLKGWKVSHPNMPILFISGSDDPCMISEKKFQKSVMYMEKVGYTNVKTAVFPNMRHEVLNEINKQDVWNKILEFVKTR